MEPRRRSALRRLVLVLDGVLIAASMPAVWSVHAELREVLPFIKPPPRLEPYVGVAWLALPVWLTLTAAFGLHRVLERRFTRFELVAQLVKLHGAGLVALSLALFLTQAIVNRSLVAVFLVTSFALMYVERELLSAWVRYQHREGTRRERLLLVGDRSPDLEAFVRAALGESLPPQIVGLVKPVSNEATSAARARAAELAARDERRSLRPSAPPGTLPVLGSVDDLAAILQEEPVDQVLFFPPLDDPRQALPALEACETVGVPASFALDLSPLRVAAPRIVRLFDRSFVTFEVAPKSPAALAVKHALDAVLAAIALVAVAPILLAAALAILVTMGRPVVFAQKRAGLRGRPFRMLKLRTMVADAEQRKAELLAQNEMSGPVFKVTNDPRVTPVGRFLRKTSIDELPQLVNVLLGQMSLVGPRPLPVEEQRAIRGWHRRRLSMKPGITCLWQIGGRNDVDFEEWMALDLRYVDEWSLGLDLRILLKTVPVVILGRGAK